MFSVSRLRAVYDKAKVKNKVIKFDKGLNWTNDSKAAYRRQVEAEWLFDRLQFALRYDFNIIYLDEVIFS